jgi:chemotaxis protein methyltransferase CheR/two-component system CheB/CheR fusion protein
MIAEKIDVPIIVGIGASAGGLEALDDFFRRIPVNSGLTFIIIQHLDPDQKDLLPEILQRITPMAVTQASDDQKVEADCVYIIPPKHDMSISKGFLHLSTPLAARGQRLPIDFFFKSLAEDQQERAIAIILSGMGSDGTKGAQFIKENAGIVLVQSVDSAKFDSMPQSIIDAGLADIIAPAHQLPASIIAYCEHGNFAQPSSNTSSNLNSDQAIKRLAQAPAPEPMPTLIDGIIDLLREHTGNDFALYKKSTIYRRIERRMGIHQIQSKKIYLSYLRNNPNELDLLFNELLIGVTHFFRDPLIWEQLIAEVLPELLESCTDERELRAWVPACSTGEEAYSLAMAFSDALEKLKPKRSFTLQVFATDLDEDAIKFAREGYYPIQIDADVPKAQLARYFTKADTGYRVNTSIREMIVFARQNIIMDPPFTKLDILSCRNLLIYLDSALQRRLIPLFHYSLSKRGILILGSAETVGADTHLFEALAKKSHIYKRIDNQRKFLDVAFPTQVPTTIYSTQDLLLHEAPMSKPLDNLQSLADTLLLRQFSPSAVLINEDGDILYINGRTGKYLEPAAGKANWNIYAMIHDDLRPALETAIRAAKSQKERAKVQGKISLNKQSTQGVEITAQTIATPKELSGLLIVLFSDFIAPDRDPTDKLSSNEKALALELQQARQALNTLREENKTSQEEVRAANEELQSTNEELQSTNEELTTSKEEMQSLNEELQTLNSELHSKVDDLSWVNNDMINLLNSTEIATLFLDSELNVRRFTSFCTPLFRLIESDVGRPLSDIVTELEYPDLQQDVNQVLGTLVFCEKQIKTHKNQWYKVRIMPYRTQENVIDGVVITLLDIQAMKDLELEE